MQRLSKSDPGETFPYLEYYPEAGGDRQRILINRSPFLIGRSKDVHHTIYSREVSKQHAEILRVGDQVLIRDLGSTNGTFVNAQRVTEAALANGDILHFAHCEYCFVDEARGAQSHTDVSNTVPAKSDLPASIIRGRERLRELLVEQSVLVLFQPIVNLETGETLGYEALGRSTHQQLRIGPSELFRLAEQCRLAPALSRLFRKVASQEARCLPTQRRVFLNLHPAETLDQNLVNSLRELRQVLRDDQTMVLEVHENVITDLRRMHWLRECLQRSGIELAYDDFGAGQARIAELTEAPPNFVKLDMGLVRGIDQATPRQELIQALNRGITELGIELIAEGIETRAEAKVCRSLGCRFGQGYLLGRPHPASLLGGASSSDHRLLGSSSFEDTVRVRDSDYESFPSS